MKLTGILNGPATRDPDGRLTFVLKQGGDGVSFSCRSVSGVQIEYCPGDGDRVTLEGQESAGMFTQVDGVERPGVPWRIFAFTSLERLN